MQNAIKMKKISSRVFLGFLGFFLFRSSFAEVLLPLPPHKFKSSYASQPRTIHRQKKVFKSSHKLHPRAHHRIHSSSTSLFPLVPRITASGFGGSDFLGTGDAMVALLGNNQQILWGDAQGRFGEEGTWMGSAGLGYRLVYNDARVLGAYAFMEHDVAPSNNSFWVVSPGIESMGNVWDFRVNGYFPVSSKTQNEGPVFGDQVGINQFEFFTGHQQYDRLFDLIEETGSGVDGEIGRTFAPLHHSRIYLGGYYFSPQNTSSVQGISGRLEIPLRSHFKMEAIDTYDNLAHNTALIGLQISLGGFSNEAYPTDADERILDPVSRNLSVQSLGNGVPVVQTEKDEGRTVLERDHIYFFNAVGGSSFNAASGAANCTYENPCNGGSFTQSTVNSINGFEPNTNFYFTPGTYTFSPSPNGRIALNGGQSMWGRTSDYFFSASGDNRALFVGGLDLLQGNNRLDSIRLLNSVTTATSGAEITALNIQNAPNVVLFNDDINATATVTGNLSTGNAINFASGVYANNSQVIIKDSAVSGNARVNGSNTGRNYATGIGSNVSGTTANFSNNSFTIINSSIGGTALISGDSNINNFAAGIGANVRVNGVANFTNNNFNIENSSITGVAIVSRNLNASASNLATGIGANVISANSMANFTGNNFVITNSTVTGTASVGLASNTSASNLADGMGSNGLTGNDSGTFAGNTIVLQNSNIEGIAAITGLSNGSNFATGIGGNVFPSAGNMVNFTSNNITVINSNISGSAAVGGNNNSFNIAIGMGGNSRNALTNTNTMFINNNIAVSGSTIGATASVSGNNGNGAGDLNQAIGVNIAGGGNTINMSQDILNVIASVAGSNSAGVINNATGLVASGSGDAINIANSTVNVSAIVSGTNSGTNSATPTSGNVISTSTTYNTTQSP